MTACCVKAGLLLEMLVGLCNLPLVSSDGALLRVFKDLIIILSIESRVLRDIRSQPFESKFKCRMSLAKVLPQLAN